MRGFYVEVLADAVLQAAFTENSSVDFDELTLKDPYLINIGSILLRFGLLDYLQHPLIDIPVFH